MKLEPRQYVDELALWFRAHAQPEKATRMSAYMRDQYPFLGLQATERNALLKEFVQANGKPEDETVLEQVVRLLWEMPEREFQNIAMSLLDARSKRTDKSRITLLEFLITQKSWWDTVDFLAGNALGKYLRHYPEEIANYPDKWIKAENLWLRRSALIFQLHYKHQTDEARLFNYIRLCAHEREFFIAKAIGWALRQYARVSPGAVVAFVESEPLQPLSKREALKRIKS